MQELGNLAARGGDAMSLVGQTFWRLTIIEDLGVGEKGHRVVRARCVCRKETVVAFYAIKRGGTKSCGCLAKDKGRFQSRHSTACAVDEDFDA